MKSIIIHKIACQNIIKILCLSILILLSMQADADEYTAAVKKWNITSYGLFDSIDEAKNLINSVSSKKYDACISKAQSGYNPALGPYPAFRCEKVVLRSEIGRQGLSQYTIDSEQVYQQFDGDYLITIGTFLNPPTTTTQSLPSVAPITVTLNFLCDSPIFALTYRSVSDPNKYGPYCKRTSYQESVPEMCPASPSMGNPINLSTGDKREHEIDYSSGGGVLTLERFYLNQREGWSFTSSSLIDLTQRRSQAIKPACWGSSITYNTYDIAQEKTITVTIPYCYPYVYNSQENYEVLIHLENSTTIRFGEQSTNNFSSSNPYNGKLEVLDPASNYGATWLHTRINNQQYYYSKEGKLLKKKFPNGHYLDYSYDASNLSAITDDTGRSLNFLYESNNKISTVILPDQNHIDYLYDSEGNITKITWPDGSFKSYLYNELNYVSASAPKTLKALTGKVDEKGVRNGTYYYDSNGRAISTEKANGVEKFIVDSYGFKATDPIGSVTSYGFNYQTDKTLLLASQSQPAGSGCAASTKNITYTTNGLISKKTEFNGNTILYGYNTINLEDRRVEGVTSSASTSLLNAAATLPAGARKTSTEWHPNWRKETRVAEPKKIITHIYNGLPDPFTGGTASCAPSTVTAPLLCKKVEQATTDANGALGFTATLDTTISQREWRYTYNNFGKILTAVTPHDILKNVVGTTNVYYSTTTANYHVGDLQSTTNALNQTTQYLNYDANGRVLEILRADGSHQWFTYDLRGRLKTSKLDNDTTTYNYDLAGNLTSVVSPTGSVINYEYDAAHRLKATTNSAGDRIEYTLDNAGNTTALVMRDAGGTLKYQQQKVYDALSRVKQIIDTKTNTTTYLYDANGNPTGVKDAKLQSTSNTYDALDQMKLTTNALNGQTNYSYDAAGRVTQVKDPKNHSTVYNYNAFGDLTSQVSPDTGTTNFTYDAAGNRTSATDARGVVVNYFYDALQRLTSVTYPASTSENISFTYDSTANGSYGIGRLASVSTAAARNDYEYNHLGLITKKYSLVGSTLSTTQYSYDAAGNLTGIIYPTGRSVTYVRDTSGRIQSISTQANLNAASQTVLSGINYLPFGPASSYNYGNGLSHTLSYDNDYRLNTIQVGGVLLRNYGFDAVDNITSITDSLVSTKNQTFNYDALNRITSATGNYGSLGYTYDAVGNRLTETKGSSTSTYTIDTNSNRLLNISGTTPRSFTYDAAGNRITGTSETGTAQTFNYNKANRLSNVTVASVAVGTYTYNALGQRVSKIANGNVQELYHYDEAGQLIAVTNATGIVQREYIYNGNSLASFTNNGTLYYVHNDHHNAPQVVTNQSGQVVWMMDYQPFGKVAAGQTNSIEIYSRFPGQFYDAETGLYQNYFRDYDPSIGRYIESDPIGLGGGVNTYGYVKGNPLRFVDPKGLMALAPGWCGWDTPDGGAYYYPCNHPVPDDAPQKMNDDSSPSCPLDQQPAPQPPAQPVPPVPQPTPSPQFPGGGDHYPGIYVPTANEQCFRDRLGELSVHILEEVGLEMGSHKMGWHRVSKLLAVWGATGGAWQNGQLIGKAINCHLYGASN